MSENEPQKLNPSELNQAEPGRTKRKNQTVLDFLEDVKKRLNDNTKSFGLYIKLYKGFGREKIEWAVKISLKNQGVAEKDKFRYFLGILKKDPSTALRTSEIKEKSATVNKDALALYKKMKVGLKKKMTPKIQKRASLSSKIAHEVSRLERKSKRK